MGFLGKASGHSPKPLSLKLSNDDATTKYRMEPNHKSESSGNATSTRSLAERVRDLTAGRRSAPVPSGSGSDAPLNPLLSLPVSRHSVSTINHVDTEQCFLETCQRTMDKGKPLRERITAVKEVVPELGSYSVDSLRVILFLIEDLVLEDAPLEARKACYELLRAAALHSDLVDEDRIRLFTVIRIPVAPRDSKLQLLALKALVQDGRRSQPSSIQWCRFVVDQLNIIFDATLNARSTIKKNRIRRPKDPIAEEEALEELLSLVKNVATHIPATLPKDLLSSLVGALTILANKTTAQKDLIQVASIFAIMTKSTSIPPQNLKSCVEVLSGIACTVDPQEGGNSWQTFRNLLTSADQVRTLEFLLNILLDSGKDRQSVVVRGALLTVKRILEAGGDDGLPVVPVQVLLKALKAASSISSRLRIDCLQILVSCLKVPRIAKQLLIADWSTLNQIIYGQPDSSEHAKESAYSEHQPTKSSPLYRLVSSGQLSALSPSEGIRNEQLQLAYLFEPRWSEMEDHKRGLVLCLLLHLGIHLDNNILDLAIDHMIQDRLIFPPNENWRSHLQLLLDLCVCNASKPVRARSRILEAIADILKNSKTNSIDLAMTRELILSLLKALPDSKDTAITNAIAELGIHYAMDTDLAMFDSVLCFLVRAVGYDTRTSSRGTPSSELPENCAATSLVWLFLQCLPLSAPKARKTYESLILVASDKALPTDARLTVMKLLVRIRCNYKHQLKVVSVPDHLGLAATLYRTEASSQLRASTYGSSNRASVIGDSPGARVGRTSGMDHTGSARSRSTTRSGGPRDWSAKAIPPLWMYPGSRGLPIDPPLCFHENLFVCGPGNCDNSCEDLATLPFDSWLEIVIDILQKGSDWEIYSYILVHLPSQLQNISLLSGHGGFLQILHRTILSQLRTGNLHEPPPSTGVKKGDVAVCLYHSLTVLVNYREHLGREQLDETVRIFLTGISMWDRAAQCCIHALALCSHEIPSNLRRSLLAIIQKLAQIITQSYLAIDILEFLAGLVRLPEAYQIAGPDGQDFLRTIFGICISYIHHSREQREKEVGNALPRSSSTPARLSGFSSKSAAASDGSQAEEAHKDLSDYVFTLAYHVMTFWFLAIDLRERSKHVGWIVKNLTWKDELGNESMEEQSQVTLDMIHRTAYNDLGETKANEDFRDANGPLTRETWLYGMSVITLETVQATGLTQITKRQASGTTHAMYQQYTAQLPPHHVPMPSTRSSGGADLSTKVFPQHVLLQLGFTIAPVPIPLQPILLPEDEFMKRAISSFDRNDTVDGHKAGVVYISEGQCSEAEILANTCGTRAYEDFLEGLGTKIRLQEANFNTQGLDRVSDMDGTHTYAWRDRVSEIIFHVTTMMPTNRDDDPHCISKKRHIGNDYVNIIYNDSGLPYNFDTFSSQFNHINIVITPGNVSRPLAVSSFDRNDTTDTEDLIFFTVQTVCSSSYPTLSPAATPKVVSAKVLPGFIRQLALNTSVFSLVWSNREGGQNISSWRNRLKEIIKLRQRYANTGTPANILYPGMGSPADRGGAPSYVDGDEWKGNLAMAGLAEQDGFLYSADFSRWN